MMWANSVVNSPEHFRGKILYFLENWKNITSDPWILKQVKGNKLEFARVPQQAKMP